MKSTRTCPSCKWEYPLDYPQTKCKFCKTEFETQRCKECKEWLPTATFPRHRSSSGVRRLVKTCPPCRSRIKNEYNKANREKNLQWTHTLKAKRQAEAQAMYERWQEQSSQPFKPMTEQQWLDACNHFGGCARCGAEHIETREFFMPFKEGGKYAAWNIYPTCGPCSTLIRRTDNPFLWMVGKAASRKFTDERRKRLVDYLILQIEVANELREN